MGGGKTDIRKKKATDPRRPPPPHPCPSALPNQPSHLLCPSPLLLSPFQSADYVCLVRAAAAKRKIAAAVPAKDAARFLESYGTILKAHMDGLKKKEKAKKGGGGKK